MATSRSVAAMVRVLSSAVSLTHWRTGLGVLEATTLPAMSRASRRAPRLQMTFMPDAFRLGSFSPLRLEGGGYCNSTICIREALDNRSSDDAWRIVDKKSLRD